MNTLSIVVVAFVIGAVLSWFADRIFVRRSGYRDGFRPRRPLSSKVLSAVIGGIVLGVIGAIIGTLTVGRRRPDPAATRPSAGPPPASPSRGAAGSTAPPAAGARAPETREWQPARTVDDGRTNVRQGPTTQDKRVTMLLPAQDVEVKPGPEWSQVRLPGKSQPLGYVRNDRIQRQP